MAVRSKWQSLPTEQINPATLGIDKLAAADIVEGMLSEDQKMVAAVQHEKDRIAGGAAIITPALREKRRVIFLGARTSGRPGLPQSPRIPPPLRNQPHLLHAILARGPSA